MFHKGAKIIIIVLRHLNSAYAPMQSANPYPGYRRLRATAASSLAARTRRRLVCLVAVFFGFLISIYCNYITLLYRISNSYKQIAAHHNMQELVLSCGLQKDNIYTRVQMFSNYSV